MRLPFRTPLVRSLVAALALTGSATAVRAEIALFDLQTNYLPVEEFAAVKLRFASIADPSVVFLAERPAFTFQNYLEFVRIADFDAPTGNYQLTVDLLGGDGQIVARDSTLVQFTESRFIHVIKAKPVGSATKSGALQTDADGDGAISGGDVVRYTVTALGGVRRSFTDELAPGLALVAGSVATTHGMVLEGNSPGDTRVVIVDMGFGSVTPAVVEFDAVVLPEVINQAVVLFTEGNPPPGPFGGQYASLRVHTDDPATPEPDDPTRIAVACGASTACVEDLDACEAELGSCEADLGACAAERTVLEQEVADLAAALAAVLEDPDADEVPAIADVCPGSAPGAPVDSLGCSLAQFCGAIDLAVPPGQPRCRNADWGNDEPIGNPRDCRTSAGLCVPD